MYETKIYYDGTAIHYNKPDTVKQTSLQNLKQNKVSSKIDNVYNLLKVETKGRTYKLKSVHKRKIRAAVSYLFYTSKKNCYLHFITVTFSGDVPNDERTRQDLFKKFIKNISAYRDVTGYVAVKERGEKNGLIHYHLVLSMPFVSYKKLNNDLDAIHKNNGYTGSSNCFTSSSKRGSTIIRNYDSAIRYITKYMGKSADVFTKPCYFISQSARVKAITAVNSAKLTAAVSQHPHKYKWENEFFAVTKHDRAIYSAMITGK